MTGKTQLAVGFPDESVVVVYADAEPVAAVKDAEATPEGDADRWLARAEVDGELGEIRALLGRLQEGADVRICPILPLPPKGAVLAMVRQQVGR